jgi:methylenetetrahydrofolate--tRNA-(uracil-5-)-methyltransferase
MGEIRVVGGGLAGCEAAAAAARAGAKVTLYEMRPETPTPAHVTQGLAELVCSNSLKSLEPLSAPWILKREMARLGSVTLKAAFDARVPAGVNLSVDRAAFSAGVERALAALPNVRVVRERVDALDDGGPWIVASGPLTAPGLAAYLGGLTGVGGLFFFDAIAPIVTAESLDSERCFAGSRWGRGGDDYMNCPLDKAEYEAFVRELLTAEKHRPHGFEEGHYFEGCLPIEETARRGPDTLRFGPMKPVGLTDPKTGRRPWACVQLRRENAAGSLYNLVGFQTQLKWGEQERLLRMIPALSKAEFARFGSMHRNTYVSAPDVLESGLRLKARPDVLLAGQVTGVEGYTESAASGILAGINAARILAGEAVSLPPRNSMMGSLVHYLSVTEAKRFQPVNAMWGLVDPLPGGEGRKPKESKYARFLAYRERAVREFEDWARTLGIPLGDASGLDDQAAKAAVEAEERKAKA